MPPEDDLNAEALEDDAPEETLGSDEEPEGHDEGGDTDEGQQEPQGDDAEGRVAAQQARGDRENRAIRDAKRARQDAEREREAAIRERDELRTQFNAIQQRTNQPDPRAQQLEAERLAVMDPEQRFEHFRQQDQQRIAALEQRLTFRLEDATDKAAFEALQARNPLAAKYAPDVEKLIASERNAGRNVSREVALKFVIGEKFLQKAPAQTTRQRAAASTRVASQTTAPRSQAGMGREARGEGDDVGALEKRLRNQVI